MNNSCDVNMACPGSAISDYQNIVQQQQQQRAHILVTLTYLPLDMFF